MGREGGAGSWAGGRRWAGRGGVLVGAQGELLTDWRGGWDRGKGGGGRGEGVGHGGGARRWGTEREGEAGRGRGEGFCSTHPSIVLYVKKGRLLRGQPQVSPPPPDLTCLEDCPDVCVQNRGKWVLFWSLVRE